MHCTQNELALAAPSRSSSGELIAHNPRMTTDGRTADDRRTEGRTSDFITACRAYPPSLPPSLSPSVPPSFGIISAVIVLCAPPAITQLQKRRRGERRGEESNEGGNELWLLKTQKHRWIRRTPGRTGGLRLGPPLPPLPRPKDGRAGGRGGYQPVGRPGGRAGFLLVRSTGLSAGGWTTWLGADAAAASSADG